ncbi:MAG: VTT domain-containing protein [Chloroflexota bacterium]|nr:VTT domain-containing protein [Chloroflexota bacterium]
MKVNNITGKLKQPRWLKIVLYTILLIGLSIGFFYLMQYLMSHFNISLENFAGPVYLFIFVITLVGNAGIIIPTIPAPIYLSIMATIASQYNPFLVALVASVGGTLGEIAGYYAGYLGKKIMFAESTPGYNRLAGWMKRHGPWAIFLISLQPILPVDIAGILSGISRIPLWKFLLPCWPGKFLKYLAFCYFGASLLDLLPL